MKWKTIQWLLMNRKEAIKQIFSNYALMIKFAKNKVFFNKRERRNGEGGVRGTNELRRSWGRSQFNGQTFLVLLKLSVFSTKTTIKWSITRRWSWGLNSSRTTPWRRKWSCSLSCATLTIVAMWLRTSCTTFWSKIYRTRTIRSNWKTSSITSSGQ